MVYYVATVIVVIAALAIVHYFDVYDYMRIAAVVMTAVGIFVSFVIFFDYEDNDKTYWYKLADENYYSSYADENNTMEEMQESTGGYLGYGNGICDSMGEVVPNSVYADNYLNSGNGNIYPPENLIDHNYESCWQDGVKGDGLGTTVGVGFDTPTSISHLRIYNGNHRSDEKYYQNNRPAEITITTSNGTMNVTLEDVNTYHEIDISPIGNEVSGIYLTINSVYSGEKWDDTCISEISFYNN